MALACATTPLAFTDTSNLTDYTVTGFTPIANALIVVIVHAYSTVDYGGISGGSLNWQLLNRITAVTGSNSIYIWYAQAGASPGNTVLHFLCPTDAGAGIILQAFQWTGHDTSNPIVQSKIANISANNASPIIAFNNALDTGNGYCYLMSNGFTFTGIAPTNWTEISQVAITIPSENGESAFRVGGESGTSVTAGWSSGTVSIYGAVEIKAAMTTASVGYMAA